MPALLNRHQFAMPSGTDNFEPRLGFHDMNDPRNRAKVDAMLHPAVIEAALKHDLPPDPWQEQIVAEHFGERAAASELHEINPETARRDLAIANQMAAAERGEMSYDQGTGEGATPIIQGMAARNIERRKRIADVPDYQRKGQAGLQGYASNPFDEAGRTRIAQQFVQAPLGGYARQMGEGMGLSAEHAHLAERGLAGLTAVGVGVPAFMAAVQQLTTPQDQNTIPF